ncbi:hypothetical protein [Parvicella tangerina]|uniref:Uncharacterized protein n=1 Tax=Parvicella tangerina TaxID=2829795 RepID=A0A916JST6_9FLAO|nr:hypothetical protein [Parvicella tangerina]CAG5087579.1 hypothetical protein CRYO30217_03518 [Parvicella tangerina]
MKYFILYSIFIISPIFSFAGNKDSLKDNKVYFSGTVNIAHILPFSGAPGFFTGPSGAIDRDFFEWRNHNWLSIGGAIEWRKWSLSIEESITTGSIEETYMMPNKDQVLDDYGYLFQYHYINCSVPTTIFNSTIGISRIFSIPRTLLKIEPKLGFNFYYVNPRSRLSEYHDEFYGNNAYDIDYAVASVNLQHQTRLEGLYSIRISHKFSFGEIGISSFATGYWFNYRCDFYTDKAYTFSASGNGGWFHTFLGLGFNYKIYFNK